MLKAATTAVLVAGLMVSGQGAQLRTRAAAEAALSAEDRDLMHTLAAKYDCADRSKSLVNHLHDIKDHSQTSLETETEKCEQQEQQIKNQQKAASDAYEDKIDAECEPVSCTATRMGKEEKARAEEAKKVSDYNRRLETAKAAKDRAESTKDSQLSKLTALKAAADAASTEASVQTPLLDAAEQQAVADHAEEYKKALGEHMKQYQSFVTAARIEEKNAMDACDTDHAEVHDLADGEQQAIQEIEDLLNELKACGEDSTMPSTALLEEAAETKTQAKCTLARAKLHRRLSAHAAVRPAAAALLEQSTSVEDVPPAPATLVENCAGEDAVACAKDCISGGDASIRCLESGEVDPDCHSYTACVSMFSSKERASVFKDHVGLETFAKIMNLVALHLPTSEGEHGNLDLDGAVATSQSATGFDRTSEATDGKVVYAADGSITSWRQAVATEKEAADKELAKCKSRASQAYTNGNQQALKRKSAAQKAALAKNQREDAAKSKQVQAAKDALNDVATTTGTAYSDAFDAYHAEGGPLLTYEAAQSAFAMIKDEKLNGDPVLEAWSKMTTKAYADALEAYNTDVANYKQGVTRTRDDALAALATQDATEKSACAGIKGELEEEIQKVTDILSKITTLTGVDAHTRTGNAFMLKSGLSSFVDSNFVKAHGPDDRAHCRCANHEGTKAISVCQTGWGTPRKECSVLANELEPLGRFGCTGGSAHCNHNQCECACQPTVHSNTMTFEQCKTECANVGMVIPFNDLSRRSAVNTGCNINGLRMWIDTQ